MYKRTWNKKFGKSEIYKREDSFCQKVEIDMLRLADSDVKSYREVNKEYALVILGGKCTVKGDNFAFENAGKRKDVFDGAATCIYAHRLMNHHARVRKRRSLSFLTCHQQHSGHRSGHTGTDGSHITADVLHGIVNTQAGINRPARRIDID